MKNAIILHGTGCNPKSYWIPGIEKYLKSKKYAVWVPQLPNPNSPDIKISLPFIFDTSVSIKSGKFIFNKDTILIGHSSGCPLILSVLEKLDIKISKAILVAGFARPIRNKSWPILQDKYDWEKIKANVGEIIFINSNNDPWKCDDGEGRYMFDSLGGTLIIASGQGHFGSDSYNQPYKRFELLERLLP